MGKLVKEFEIEIFSFRKIEIIAKNKSITL